MRAAADRQARQTGQLEPPDPVAAAGLRDTHSALFQNQHRRVATTVSKEVHRADCATFGALAT